MTTGKQKDVLPSRISTKTGDGGFTHIRDGTSLRKDHPIPEALGALDDMRTHMALLRTQLIEQRPEAREEHDFLLFLLHCCFLLGTALSDPHGRGEKERLLKPFHLEKVEAEQERMESALTLPAAFVVCAANPLAAQADRVAAAARCFERRFITAQDHAPALTAPLYGRFINRLSDYFFVLARHLEKGVHESVDYRLLDKPHGGGA
ncbi:MAG: ATP:cob(I)alamin adenosyltransferase [Candidatus Hydrogenedentes bacterium]|jgi:cob(I)alamin adenosyltransferase|nr:ATP:cob(I)alamin adenosyltransferase [Candidatus Hydrogenedentota bacterium]